MGLKSFNHVDLFSGIGGFALAARNVWGNEYNNVCFCEINKYAQAVLRKNFGKDVVICDDIRKLTINSDCFGCYAGSSDREEGQVLPTSKRQDAKDKRERSGRLDRSGEGNRINIDLLTGGFPCQPFSQAGQRRGTEDDRFLWPEMLRVISEFRPTWIIGENVAGLLSMAEFDGESQVASETDLFGNSIDVHTKRGRGVLYRIIGELEQIGYSVQTFVIPACAVGAPHRRDRVWIVGRRIDGDSESYGNPSEREISSKGKRNQESADTLGSDRRNQQKEQIVAHSQSRKSGVASEREGRESIGGGDTEGGIRSSSHHQLRLQEPRPELEAGRDRPDHQDARDTESEHERFHRVPARIPQVSPRRPSGDNANDPREHGLPYRDAGAVRGQTSDEERERPAIRHFAPEQWDQNWLEVATRFCGVDDGLPGEMDGATLSKAGHRVERLKALGNAIVPQVAEQIMKSIKEIEQC
jgi:DNA (cytosine-5)-methyltransferase 1